MDLNTAHWRKSSYSGHDGGDCVEVAALPGAVAVRDSKNPAGPVLTLTSGQWRALLDHIKAGGHTI